MQAIAPTTNCIIPLSTLGTFVIVMDREAWHAVIHGVAKRHD